MPFQYILCGSGINIGKIKTVVRLKQLMAPFVLWENAENGENLVPAIRAVMVPCQIEQFR
jgi:hypothetical protein